MIADRSYYKNIMQRTREQLSPDCFTAMWDDGRSLPLEDVVTRAQTLAEAAASPARFGAAAEGLEGRAEDDLRNLLQLSLREREVLRLIAAGHSNAEIAQVLYISLRTASTHAGHILRKLGFTNRAELIAFAHRKGFA